ncbi:MAG: hypothetical protein V1798_11865 [Pseudomonadota bacterium]
MKKWGLSAALTLTLLIFAAFWISSVRPGNEGGNGAQGILELDIRKLTLTDRLQILKQRIRAEGWRVLRDHEQKPRFKMRITKATLLDLDEADHPGINSFMISRPGMFRRTGIRLPPEEWRTLFETRTATFRIWTLAIPYFGPRFMAKFDIVSKEILAQLKPENLGSVRLCDLQHDLGTYGQPGIFETSPVQVCVTSPYHVQVRDGGDTSLQVNALVPRNKFEETNELVLREAEKQNRADEVRLARAVTEKKPPYPIKMLPPANIDCFSRDYWDHADAVNRAALVWHEAAYSLATRYFAQRDSEWIRILVAFVFSANLDQDPPLAANGGRRFPTLIYRSLEELLVQIFGGASGYSSDPDFLKAYKENLRGPLNDPAAFEAMFLPAPKEAWPWDPLTKFGSPGQYMIQSYDQLLAARGLEDQDGYFIPFASTRFKWQTDVLEILSGMDENEYTCDHNFRVSVESQKVAGLETIAQIVVRPIAQGLSVSVLPGLFLPAPSSDAFQSDTSAIFDNTQLSARLDSAVTATVDQVHVAGGFIGPSPTATLVLQSAEHSSLRFSFPQFVLMSPSHDTILWSLGGLTGTCTK